MGMSQMARVTALLVLVLAVVPAMATDYTVGDSSGWLTGMDYSTWASDKTFKVGDTLLFTYGFLHTVNEVSKSDYDSCSASNSLQSYSDQNTKITLDKPGSRYFICGTAGHCSGGMKLAVNVGGSGGGGGSPSTPTTTPSSPDSPSTTTPSGTSGEPASKNTPTRNSAAGGRGFTGGNAVVAGVSLVGLALMG